MLKKIHEDINKMGRLQNFGYFVCVFNLVAIKA